VAAIPCAPHDAIHVSIVEVVDETEPCLYDIDGVLPVASVDVVALVVRQPDASHETVGDESGHGAPGVRKRHSGLIGPMQQVQIEVVTAEAPEAHLTRSADLLRPEAGAAAAIDGPGSNLRTDKEGVRHLAQRGADDRFIAGVEVVLGGINPVDAGLSHGAQYGGGPRDL
jgi:hypothetical protein